jgi:hypothetical protein
MNIKTCITFWNPTQTVQVSWIVHLLITFANCIIFFISLLVILRSCKWLECCHGLGCVTIDGVYISDIGFIDRLYTPLATTRNYSATANIHTLQFTTAHAMAFPAYVFNSRFLVTASNSGDSSASRAEVLPSPSLVQNWLPTVSSTELYRHVFLFIIRRAELHI